MIVLKGLEETKKWGEKLGSHLFPGDVICMNGDLGAGKTTLTKSIAAGMGIDDYVTSPTFTIVNEYKGLIDLYHIDTYRLDDKIDIDYLGFDEYFYGEGVTIVEWADKIKDSLPEEYLELRIKGTGDSREVEVVAVGNRYKKLKEIVDENSGN